MCDLNLTEEEKRVILTLRGIDIKNIKLREGKFKVETQDNGLKYYHIPRVER